MYLSCTHIEKITSVSPLEKWKALLRLRYKLLFSLTLQKKIMYDFLGRSFGRDFLRKPDFLRASSLPPPY